MIDALSSALPCCLSLCMCGVFNACKQANPPETVWPQVLQGLRNSSNPEVAQQAAAALAELHAQGAP